MFNALMFALGFIAGCAASCAAAYVALRAYDSGLIGEPDLSADTPRAPDVTTATDGGPGPKRPDPVIEP